MLDDEIQEAKPFIRSILAFIVFVRFGGSNVDYAYVVADDFLQKFEADLKK
jgi:hypothetical protein